MRGNWERMGESTGYRSLRVVTGMGWRRSIRIEGNGIEMLLG